MKRIVVLVISLMSLNIHAQDMMGAKKWTISGNYQLNMQNPDGTNPTSSISLSVSPSVILQEIHEVGATLAYTVNESENTVAGTTTEVSTTMLSGFYRYNMPLNISEAKIPIIGYAGPQVGITSFEAAGKSDSDPSVGGQVGLNLMFSENLALNVHAFQFDTVFSDDTQLLITQSIGVKYIF